MSVAQIALPASIIRRRAVRLPWLSPEDQPRWARPLLLLVAAAAATIYTWGINHAQLHSFYAPAVKSMSVSWKAFFYGGYDPQASISLDKLPGAFQLQALSARIFGFHTWSVILPQVIAAVLAVLVIYRAVRRWHGPLAGLLAAVFLATTPIVAALAHSQISDGILIVLLVLAADAWQRAVATGRLRSLLLSGFWVGCAFQTKMVQAWGVLPALAIAYLIAAPIPLRKRLGHLGLAGLVTVAVSFWQVALYAVTPVSARPYADGSTNNSLLSMIFEYNLSTRFGAGGDSSVTFGPGGGAGGSVSPGYMFSDQVAPQVGWVYPLAAAGLILGLFGSRLAGKWSPSRWGGRTDLVRAGTIMWGVWFAVHAIAFSTGRVAHSFYVVATAPAVAALAAGGLVTLWRLYRRGSWMMWLLPAMVAVTVGWTLYLRSHFGGFDSWLTPAVAAVGLVAVGGLVAARLTRRLARQKMSGYGEKARSVRRWTARLAAGGGVLALLAMVLAPAAWAGSTVSSKYVGSSIGPAAGPGGGEGFGGQGGGYRMRGDLPAGVFPPGGLPGGQNGGGQNGGGQNGGGQNGGGQNGGGQAQGGGPRFGGGGGGGFGGVGTTPSAQTKALLSYLRSQQHGEKYLVAATGSQEAGPLIMAGASVLPMGGFTGQVPFPTTNQLASLVAKGQLRYVLVGGGRGFGGNGGNNTVQTWVTSNCQAVDASAYGGGTASGTTGQDFGGGGSLYDCRANA
jgi:4-amino-4-deoxy-L-arabinose transferase-like glycosyltransferase